MTVPGEVTVILHKNDIPLLVGYGRENLKWFADRGIALRWDPSGKERGVFTVTSGTEKVRGAMTDG